MADSNYLLDLVPAVVERLGGRATYKQIIEEVQKERPKAPVTTLRTFLILLSVNQPSRIHQPQNQKPRATNHERYDVLYSLSPGEVELYDPARHGQWEIRQEGDHTVVVDPEGKPVRTSTPTNRIEHAQAWVVRAGQENKHAKKFEEFGKIAIGFKPAGDLSGMSAEEIESLSTQAYVGESAHTIGARAGTLKSFALGIKKGDLVLTPTETHSEVLVGRVTGDYEFTPEPMVGNFQHNRSVEWIGARVSRKSLPEATQKGLDAPRTVYKAGGAAELHAMFGSGSGDASGSERAWIFQGNPSAYDVRGAVKELKQDWWTVSQYPNQIKKGHRVYFWEAGPVGGVVGIGETLQDPRQKSFVTNKFVADPDSLSATKLRVKVSILRAIDPPISRDEIKTTEGLADLQIIKFANATNFAVTPGEDRVLWRLVAERLKIERDPLRPPKWTNAWWVNQKTFKEESEGGYVWAPNTGKGGGPPTKHWQALTGMKVDDLIFHYYKQAIQAVSRVERVAEVTDRPSGLPLTEGEGQGWRVETKYFHLDDPIRLSEVPKEWRLAEKGPFDVNGGVKQQYANYLNKTFVQLLIDRFGDRIRNGNSIDDLPEDPVASNLMELIERRMNVVFYGPPGTGKTFQALQLAGQWKQANGDDSVRKVTFHPSYGYEDFVQGFRPRKDQPGEFALQPGILLRICDDARKAPERNFLLLIDEINRGDVARVFGELITYIETDKRGIAFDLAQDDRTQYTIPPNVYFLGTMNTADKSVSLLDVALRRRFAFVEFRADPQAFSKIPTWVEKVQGLNLGDLLIALNQRLLAEGVEVDRAIGHALLFIPTDSPNPAASLKERIEYDIAPLVAEYSYLDRGRIARILSGLVDDHGRFLSDLTEGVVIARLNALATEATAAPQLAAPDVVAELEVEALQTELDE